jgi:hypothetical protein
MTEMEDADAGACNMTLSYNRNNSRADLSCLMYMYVSPLLESGGVRVMTHIAYPRLVVMARRGTTESSICAEYIVI